MAVGDKVAFAATVTRAGLGPRVPLGALAPAVRAAARDRALMGLSNGMAALTRLLRALTEAAQRHAGPGEDGFAAYAKLRVRGAMIDLIRRTVPASRHVVERRKLLQRHTLALRGQLGREPVATEMAEAMRLTLGELGQLQSDCIEVRFEPLDEVYSESDAVFLDDGSDIFGTLAAAQVRETLIEAVAALPDRLKLIVQLYFLEELNLAEIAQVLDVSIPRVHQLNAQALAAMREAMREFAD